MSTVQVDFRTPDNVFRSVDVLFRDGPELYPSSMLSYDVLGRYSYSSSHPELNKGDPALISLKKGDGRIILSTVHFESIFLRGYGLVFDYIRIMKENPNCSPNEWFDMTLEHYEDTCAVETSPENGCVVTTPRNLASSWVIISLVINEIEKKDMYSALAP